MRCRFIVTALICLAIRSTLAQGVEASFTVFYPSHVVSGSSESADQAKKSGFADYISIVQHAAKKNQRALSRLFLIDSKTSWDAAGGEVQNSVMLQMLLIWGDHDFAAALSHEPVEIQKNVTSNFGGQPRARDFAILFPSTAAIRNRMWHK